jgi:hypothetical protein
MKGWPLRGRPSARLARLGSLLLVGAALVGCTAHGGGWLPPDGVAFAGKATLGFAFGCERSSASVNLNPPAGRLRLRLTYADHGANPLGGPFAIQGEADVLDPVLESMVCIGQEPPPGGDELIFLGRYRLASTPPSGFPGECAATAPGADPPGCRFEVVVRDNDASRGPSAGDEFAISLSTATAATGTLDPATVFYARAGVLGGGNIEVE